MKIKKVNEPKLCVSDLEIESLVELTFNLTIKDSAMCRVSSQP